MKRCTYLLALILLLLAPTVAMAQNAEWKMMHEGNAAFRSRNFEKAQSLYMKVLKRNPKNARALFNLADTYLAKGDAKLADSLFTQAAQHERNPQVKSMAFHNRGYIRQTAALHDQQNQQQLLRQAIEQYKQALRLNPHDNDTRYNLVLCQRQLKDSPNKNQQQQRQESHQNQQSKQQTEQYINLSRQAERDARQRVNNRQPRQKSLDKNW